MSNEPFDKIQKQAMETAGKLGNQAKEQYEKLSPKAKEAAEKAAAQAKEFGEKAKANPKFKKYGAIAAGIAVLAILYSSLSGGGPSSSDIANTIRAGLIQEAQEQAEAQNNLAGFFGADNAAAHRAKADERIARIADWDIDVEIVSKKEQADGSWMVSAYTTMTDEKGNTKSTDATYKLREGKNGWRFIMD